MLLALAYLPEGIEARADAAVIVIKLERGNAAAEVLEERLLLRPVDAAQQPSWPDAPGRRGKWLALNLDVQQQSRFHALRATAQQWKAQDGPQSKRKLHLALEPQMCRRSTTSPQALETLRVSAWLRWKAQQAPVQLLDEASLSDLTQRASGLDMPVCPNAAH